MHLAAQLAPRRSHPAPARAACRPRNAFPVEIFRHGRHHATPHPPVNAPSERRAPPSPHRSSRWGEGWGEGQAPAPTVRANFFSWGGECDAARPSRTPAPHPTLSPRREERRGERARAHPQGPCRGAVGWAKSPATAYSLVHKCRPAILPTWSGPRGFPRGQNRQRFGAPAGPKGDFAHPTGRYRPHKRERKQPHRQFCQAGWLRSRKPVRRSASSAMRS